VPSAHRLLALQRALAIGPAARPRAWSGRAASPYDRDAFDLAFFAATDAPPTSDALVSLGRELFFDPSLSGTGTRACATCHLPERAFTDGRSRADLIPGHDRTGRARNTPTLINAAVQPSLFADSRVRTLEDQATDVIGSAGEMGGSLAAAGIALAQRVEYRKRFEAAVGAQIDSARAARAIRLSLAAYIRTLVRLDSRFDQAVRGEPRALTVDERRGFELFMGKAACGTCHFAPLFGGAMPPTFAENEPEVIGVPSEPVRHGAQIDPDSGRFNVRPIAQHLHAFKTPSLRNIALTAPYMHNGVYRTLEEVLDFYDVGGGHGIGAALAHQTLPTDSLHLTPSEKRAIIAFLGALTDTSRTTVRQAAPGHLARGTSPSARPIVR
jgi:cytochrome c peroxidase